MLAQNSSSECKDVKAKGVSGGDACGKPKAEYYHRGTVLTLDLAYSGVANVVL